MSDPTPAELEASGATSVQIEYGDHTYTFPFFADPLDIPGDVLDAVEAGHPGQTLQALMGSEWARFKRTKPTARDYKALLDLWATRVGMGSAGE